MNKFLVYLILALALTTSRSFAAEEEELENDAVEVDRNTQPAQNTQAVTHSSRLNVGDHLGLPQGLLQIMAQGGMLAAGVLAVAALVMLIVPAFGVRMTNLFGREDPTYQGYSANPNSVYNDYPGYGQAGTYNNPVYQKRSLEYVGPILKALGNAYDKYNRQVVQTSASKNA